LAHKFLPTTFDPEIFAAVPMFDSLENKNKS